MRTVTVQIVFLASLISSFASAGENATAGGTLKDLTITFTKPEKVAVKKDSNRKPFCGVTFSGGERRPGAFHTLPQNLFSSCLISLPSCKEGLDMTVLAGGVLKTIPGEQEEKGKDLYSSNGVLTGVKVDGVDLPNGVQVHLECNRAKLFSTVTVESIQSVFGKSNATVTAGTTVSSRNSDLVTSSVKNLTELESAVTKTKKDLKATSGL